MLITPQIRKTIESYLSGKRFIIHKGSTRSGKTYGILSALILIVSNESTPTINSVVAMTLPHLKKGAIRDFVTIMQREGRWSDAAWNSTDKIYTFPNGSCIEFFSADSEKVHGAQRDRLFLNEGQFLKWDTVRQLLVRTSGAVFIDYNPIRRLWIETNIAENPERAGTVDLFHTTYKENPYLTPSQVREIESNKKDAVWWQVYGEGQTGTIRTGCIYSGWQPIDKDDYDKIDATPVYGLDFGYSPDPTAIVEIKFDKRSIYVREMLYETELTDPMLVKRMDEIGIDSKAFIIGDYGSGGGKSIVSMRQGVESDGKIYKWSNFFPAIKPKGSVLYGAKLVQGYTVYVVNGSENIWNEYNLYRKRTDPDGKVLADPVDAYNHLMDAIRYVVAMKERKLF